jgi:capsular polysaccharide biosynthesis protein
VCAMYLSDYLRVLTRHLWLLIAGTVLAMVGSYLAFRYLTPWPRYQATAVVIIGNNNPTSDWVSVEVSREMAPMYARWATRRSVLEGVIETLSLPLSVGELQKAIDARVIGDTQMMEISATSCDPEQAAAIANEVVRQLETQIMAASKEDDLSPPSKDEIARLQARIRAAEAELIGLSNALADHRPASSWTDDIARLESRIGDTEAKLVALTDRMLETDSTTEADLLTRRIDVLRSNLEMWQGELDRLYVKTVSDSEAEIGQLVRRISVLQSNLGIWQRKYSDYRVEYAARPAPPLVAVEDAQAPARATDPQVNILVAGVTGLLLSTGVVSLLEKKSAGECKGW